MTPEAERFNGWAAMVGIIAVVIAIIVGIGFYLYRKKRQKSG